MRTLPEICGICGQPVIRFQAPHMVCHRCGEVTCRRCLSKSTNNKQRWKVCRRCAGAFN